MSIKSIYSAGPPCTGLLVHSVQRGEFYVFIVKLSRTPLTRLSVFLHVYGMRKGKFVLCIQQYTK